MDDTVEWYRLPGIAVHYVAFFSGLCFMLLYYGFFHPTGPVKVDFRLGPFRRNKRGKGDGDDRPPPPTQGRSSALSFQVIDTIHNKGFCKVTEYRREVVPSVPKK